MLTAKEAYERARNKNAIDELNSHIDELIDQAVTRGEFRTIISLLSCEYTDVVVNAVRDLLMDVGYITTVEEITDSGSGWTFPQLTIYWDNQGGV